MTTEPLAPHAILKKLLAGAPLDEHEAERVFESVLTGGLDDAQIAALLSLIAVRSPTVDELVGGARVMRRHVTPVALPDPPTSAQASNPIPLLDTCGTGGAPKAFNVSTVAAVVAAAAAPGRLRIAKHGSTSRTGRGSAEVLKALGVNIDANPETQTRCLAEVGVCFCFATRHHPAMKFAAGPRRSLGFPTIFNLLGPLTNPAGARRQLLGAYDRALAHKMAETLARLGVERAIVFTSHDGLDELTITNTSVLHEIEHGRIVTRVLAPEDVGIPRGRFEDLTVNSLEDAAQAVRDIVDAIPGPRADMTALNAGLALVVAGVADSPRQGVDLARHAIASGAARATLDRLIEVSSHPHHPAEPAGNPAGTPAEAPAET